jgi:hypothetical protein
MRLRIASLSLLTILILTVAGGEEHARQKGNDIKGAAPVLASASDQSKPKDNVPPPPPTFYSNGPINGTITGWQFNNGIEVSERFEWTGGSYTPTITFGAWVDAGNPLCIPVTNCIPTSVEVSIGDTGYFSNNLYDDVVPITNVTLHNFVIPPLPPGSPCVGFCVVYSITASKSNGAADLGPGNYAITLSNAVTKSGGPIYWDENNGVGCAPTGFCPSTAQQSVFGVVSNIPSESFTFK